MKKARVPLWGSPQKSVTIDLLPATIGVNVWNADGSLFAPGAVATPAAEGYDSVVIWQRVLQVPPNVTALANTATTGLYAITAAGASATRTIQPTVGRTTVANGDGVLGDPVVDLAARPDTGVGAALVKVTFDAWGRREGTQAVVNADVAPLVVTATITDGDTTHAPSGDAVFDALAGKQDAIADSGWLAPTLLNSWINYGGSNSVAGYRKVGSRVYLRGTVKNGTITNGTTIFTLPAGYRPPATYAYRTVNTSTLTSAQVTVGVTGNVGISGIDSSTYLYFDGIAFLVD